MRSLIIFLTVALLTFGFLASASAALLTYDDLDTFLNDSRAAAEETLRELGRVGNGFSLGDLTFSLGPGATNMIVDQRSDILDGYEIALSGKEDLNVDLAGPAYSFGFQFVEPTVDSVFEVSLYGNSGFQDSFNFTAEDDNTAYFVGVWTDFLFNRVEIRETTGGLENEYYGQFYSGIFSTEGTEYVPTPEPSTILLLSGGLLCVGVYRLRKNRT